MVAIHYQLELAFSISVQVTIFVLLQLGGGCSVPLPLPPPQPRLVRYGPECESVPGYHVTQTEPPYHRNGCGIVNIFRVPSSYGIGIRILVRLSGGINHILFLDMNLMTQFPPFIIMNPCVMRHYMSYSGSVSLVMAQSVINEA